MLVEHVAAQTRVQRERGFERDAQGRDRCVDFGRRGKTPLLLLGKNDACDQAVMPPGCATIMLDSPAQYPTETT